MHFIAGYLVTLLPQNTPHMLIQVASGSLSGITVAGKQTALHKYYSYLYN